ncbi:MAG: SufD family Fe-S cluster assembly protein [Candidatus Paceibacteria bacterium]
MSDSLSKSKITDIEGVKPVNPNSMDTGNDICDQSDKLNKIISIEKNRTVEETIKISPKFEQLGIVLKQDSKANIFKQTAGEDQLQVKIFLHQGSELNYYTNNITLKKGKFEHKAYLLGEHSQVRMYSLNLSKKQQQIKEKIQAIHKSDKSSSDIKVKSVLMDRSRISSNVLTKVEGNCFNCSGEQQIDGLMYSDMAMMDAQPNLEIANDQVECSHGVTISRLDDEDIFYLLSRGLNKEDSYKKLVQAHFGEILTNINDSDIKSEIKNQIQSRI